MFPLMRACTDQSKIESFLSSARIGYLGLTDGSTPYVVPLNFVWVNNRIYFHGSANGKKVDLIKQNASACFTISEEYGTLAHPVPAETDTAYMSVMIFGKAELVEEIEEATEALDHMLTKYVPNYYETHLAKEHVSKYRSSRGNPVGVYRIEAVTITAKENPLKEDKLFYPGRTRAMDSGKLE